MNSDRKNEVRCHQEVVTATVDVSFNYHLHFPLNMKRELVDDDNNSRYAHPERDRGGDRQGHGRRDRDGGRGSMRPPPVPEDRRTVRGGYENVPTGPRADRGKAGTSNAMAVDTPLTSAIASSHPMTNTLPEPATPYSPSMTDEDLSAIRSRYLGVDKKKRKIRKMNDRKFIFDWDAQDDTFAEDSPVAGSNRQGAQVMFGRGRLAGMDDGGGSGPRRSGSTAAVVSQHTDALERRKAEKSGLDERHWTEKPLDEMKERDWRIFREDFNISARGMCFDWMTLKCSLIRDLGGHIPHALRSWTESAIPEIILDCIANIGYKDPSPIQRQAIPIGLQNRDIIGIAETGHLFSPDILHIFG